MDRHYYLGALNYYLSPMPEAQRYELLRSLEAHFDDGLRNGRTEEEIVRELGDPKALAARILNTNPAEAAPEYGTPAPAPGYAARKPDTARLLGVGLLLGFLNLFIAIPLGFSLWAALLSFGAAALGFVCSPAMVLVDWLANDVYFPATLFATIAMAGVGLLLGAAFIFLFKLGFRATRGYLSWNLRLWKGAQPL